MNIKKIEDINFGKPNLILNANYNIMQNIMDNIPKDFSISILGQENDKIKLNPKLLFKSFENATEKYIITSIRFNVDIIILHNFQVNDEYHIIEAIESGHSVILLNCFVNDKILKEHLEENYIIDLNSFILKEKLNGF